jgi:hypothetical protein
MAYQAGRIVTHLYDMVIFLPLSIEHMVRKHRADRDSHDTDEILVSRDETVGGIKP